MYIEIPGSKTHELPPLLVHGSEHRSDSERSELDSVMVEAEDMLGVSDAEPEVLEQRKFELALKLTEQYHGLLAHWMWGDSVLEWIRQCEITFECEDALRNYRRPDLWPHAGRASFVALLIDKHVPTHGVALERAVGFRLMFREPFPIRCLSNQFLFYLNPILAETAYQSWAQLTPGVTAFLPPERFHFEVLDIGEEQGRVDN